MRQWLQRLGSVFTSSGASSPSQYRRRVIRYGLESVHGHDPSPELINKVLANQTILDDLHTRFQDSENEVNVNELFSFQGRERLEALRDQKKGYLLVYSQPFLTRVLTQFTQDPKPWVSVVFQAHEDPAAHVTVLERGHGLAFELDFFPDDNPAILCAFFDHLSCVSTRASRFAIETLAPIAPVWGRIHGENEFSLEIGEPITQWLSEEDLTLQLIDYFVSRIERAPEHMDWEANCWDPPARRILTSRRDAPLVLRDDSPLGKLRSLSMLVRVPNGVREACLAIPALRALKRGRPDVHLTVLTEPQLLPIWRSIPECDDLLVVGAEDPDRMKIGFDVGVILSLEDDAIAQIRRYQIDRLLGMESLATAAKLDEILKMPRKLGPPEHRQRTYLRIPQRLGAEVVNDPSIFAPIHRAIPPNAETPMIAVAPGSEDGSSYSWEQSRFIEMIQESKLGANVVWKVFLSTDEESQVTAWETEIAAHPELPLILEPWQDDLEKQIEKLSACYALVSNDNRFLHLAATIGTPTVGIYGPSEPAETSPPLLNARTVRKHVECTPCFLAECPIDHRCMKEISINDVLTPLREILTPD